MTYLLHLFVGKSLFDSDSTCSFIFATKAVRCFSLKQTFLIIKKWWIYTENITCVILNLKEFPPVSVFLFSEKRMPSYYTNVDLSHYNASSYFPVDGWQSFKFFNLLLTVWICLSVLSIARVSDQVLDQRRMSLRWHLVVHSGTP